THAARYIAAACPATARSAAPRRHRARRGSPWPRRQNRTASHRHRRRRPSRRSEVRCSCPLPRERPFTVVDRPIISEKTHFGAKLPTPMIASLAAPADKLVSRLAEEADQEKAP